MAKIRLPNVKSLIILRSREGLTSSNKKAVQIFLVQKAKLNVSAGFSLSFFFFFFFFFFQNTQKNLKLHLVLVVGLVLES